MLLTSTKTGTLVNDQKNGNALLSGQNTVVVDWDKYSPYSQRLNHDE